jgi:hypothetical protein
MSFFVKNVKNKVQKLTLKNRQVQQTKPSVNIPASKAVKNNKRPFISENKTNYGKKSKKNDSDDEAYDENDDDDDDLIKYNEFFLL